MVRSKVHDPSNRALHEELFLEIISFEDNQVEISATYMRGKSEKQCLAEMKQHKKSIVDYEEAMQQYQQDIAAWEAVQASSRELEIARLKRKLAKLEVENE